MDNLHIAVGLAVTVVGLSVALALLLVVSKIVDLASGQQAARVAALNEQRPIHPRSLHWHLRVKGQDFDVEVQEPRAA
ncbi:MAG TPA: hypothetical protein GX513_04400 [Firmicutes bacterium]|nr:hypothetical protein [Bacillota bacterium]